MRGHLFRTVAVTTAGVVAFSGLGLPASAYAAKDPGVSRGSGGADRGSSKGVHKGDGKGVRRNTDTLKTNAVFNDPRDAKKKGAIVTYLKDLIDGAKSGSQIQVVAFRIQDTKVIDPLMKAAKRGVAVRIVIDAGNQTKRASDSGELKKGKKRFAELVKQFANDSSKSTSVTFCEKGNACIGDNKAKKAIMHSKFFMFSKTSGASDVVVFPTANLNFEVGGTGGFNSAYTDVGNRALFMSLTNYFNDLMAGAKNHKKFTHKNYYDFRDPKVNGNVKTYFHPRAQGDSKKEDTYVNILEGVSCGSTKTRIRISNWYIGRPAVAAKLRALQFAGCRVDIVANQIDAKSCGELTKVPFLKVPEIHGFPASQQKDKGGTHEKNMMIDGTYLGKKTKVTFTGSHNLTEASLNENDEVTVRVFDSKIHDQFVKNFDAVKKAASVTVRAENQCHRVAPPKKD